MNSRHLVDEHFLHAVVGLDGVGKIETHLERARFVGQFQPVPAGLDGHTVGAVDGAAVLERAGVLADHAGRHEFAAGADLLHVLRCFGSHPLRVCRGVLAQDGGQWVSGLAVCICFDAGRRHEHRSGLTRSRAFHLVDIWKVGIRQVRAALAILAVAHSCLLRHAIETGSSPNSRPATLRYPFLAF